MIVGKMIIWFLLFLGWAVVVGIGALIIAKVIEIILNLFKEDELDKKDKI